MAQVQLERQTPKMPGMESVYGLVEADLARVQESLRQIVPPETVVLAESVHHSMTGGGKLFRPLLSLLASGASGALESPHIEAAAVAELIHVATLLHDDVLDESDTRRGRSTVKALWGNKVSILSGDYLLAQASLKLSTLNNCRLVSIFSTVLSNLCEGEVEQIQSSFNLQTSWESYFKKSMCKTASLFAACCESAGVLNQLPEEHIQRLRLYGEKFGIAFQIIDDLLDYTSSAQMLGKPVLDDLKNGLLNAPILLAFESKSLSDEQKGALKNLVSTIFEQTSPDQADSEEQKVLLNLLESSNAIRDTQVLAEQYAQEAREALAFLPSSPYLTALMDITQIAIQRRY